MRHGLRAEEYANHHRLRFVHSSDEPLLVAGVGTAALELLESAPDLDVIFVPVGGGSGLMGAGVVARAVNPAIKVIGVQAEGRRWRFTVRGEKVAVSSRNPSQPLPKGLQPGSPSPCRWPFCLDWSTK